MRLLPEHGSCLVCGTANSHSFGLRWYADDDDCIHGSLTLSLQQQGPPSFAHGGALAALVDEAMGTAVWVAGHPVVAANLNVDYLKPVPLDEPVEVIGQVVEVLKQGKVILAEARIHLPDGAIAVKSTGTFVRAPHLFEKPFLPE